MNKKRYSNNEFVTDFNFEKLIAPWSSERFFEEFFEKKILLIKRNNQDYYQGLLSPSDLDNIFFHWPNDVSVESAEKSDVVKPKMSFGIRQTNVQSVMRDFDEGNSVVFDNLDQRHPPLSRVCALLEKEHAWRYQANVHLNPAGSQGGKPEVYNYNAFILQTTGSGSWCVNRAPSLAMSEDGTPATPEIDAENHDTFVLEPGDLVYIPGGFAHDAATSAVPSAHITLRPHPPSWGEVITYIVNRCIETRPELRMSTPPGFVEQVAGDVAEPIKQRLLELSNLTLLNEVRAFMGSKSSMYRGLFYGALQRRLQTPEFDLDGLYMKNQYLKIYTELIDDKYRVHTPQKLVDLPIVFKQSIEFCLSGDEFAIAAIPGMDLQEKMVLVDRLLAEGIVIKAGMKSGRSV